MEIGIPKEHRPDENRVALTPSGVGALAEAGHRVYIETLAGAGSGFTDDQYAHSGASVVYSAHEAWQRGELILKVARPLPDELAQLTAGQILAGFLHLAAGKRQKIDTIVATGASALAWEMVQAGSELPVLAAMSQIAGRLAVQIAARLLENQAGGKGILLSGVPGVPPAEVAIIGAGTVGRSAALSFVQGGAAVHVLDKDLRQLRLVDQETHGRAITMVSTAINLRKVLGFADVVVGAAQVPGARAPLVVSREMVRLMRPRSVIIDFAIDQGGCIETSRPTTLHDPTYREEGVIHWCVPNVTGAVSRTATHTFTNATLPYIHLIGEQGLEGALDLAPELRCGLVIRNGQILRDLLANLAVDPSQTAGQSGVQAEQEVDQ